MDRRILIGTEGGLWAVDRAGAVADEGFAGHPVVALAHDGERTWAIVGERTVWATDAGRPWQPMATVDGHPATCLATTTAGLIAGTEQAHLVKLVGDRFEPLESFESVEGREAWYTPWGDPADVRSIAVDCAGTIYVNVHVGGVVRSRDGGRSWTPTLDIEADVHQVLADPVRPGVVLVAAAVGFGVSRDGGDSWDFFTAGLHGRYSRAVAVAGETALVTASTGPSGRRAAVYRRPLDADVPLERCRQGLPVWFSDNVDTACLAAAGPVVVFGTGAGEVFWSFDAGATWDLAAKGLPAVRCVLPS